MLHKLKRILLALRYYLLCRDYRTILNSGLFDAKYYRGCVPGLQNSDKSSLIHYVDFGVHEGKSPSPLFDPDFYREKYNIIPPEDPFIHYLTVGMATNNLPCEWFDPKFYQLQYGGTEGTRSPLEQYLESGRQQGAYPNHDIFSLVRKPVVSVIVPVYNVSSFHLNNCIQSVVNQSYPHWELCMVDDCSTMEHIRPLLQQWASKDSRIRVSFLEKNSGISAASNAAVRLAGGEFFGFLDNDDELAVECLSKIVAVINEKKADLYYTDEDLIGEDGRQFSVFRKPDSNPELLLCHNYITHFVVVEATLFRKTGGFDSAKDGAQDYDLLLKMTELAEKVVHVPEVLYHWRASESSTSVNHDQKSYAHEAGRNAVKDALERRNKAALVESGQWKFFYNVTKEFSSDPPVAVVILWRENIDLSKWLLKLISLTSYPSVNYYLITDLSLQNHSIVVYPDTVHVLKMDMNKSDACLYNEVVSKLECDYVVFLGAEISMKTADWLQALLGHCMESDVAVAGGTVTGSNGHTALTTLPDLRDTSSVYYSIFVQECSRHMNGLHCVQNVCALSWRLLMTERSIFLDHGGFDEEHFPDLFADSDYCLRLREAGYAVVFSPFAAGETARTILFQDKEVDDATGAKALFQQRWRSFLLAGDPFYNRGILKDAGIDLSEFLVWYAGE